MSSQTDADPLLRDPGANLSRDFNETFAGRSDLNPMQCLAHGRNRLVWNRVRRMYDLVRARCQLRSSFPIRRLSGAIRSIDLPA
jgi:hypothetical protein